MSCAQLIILEYLHLSSAVLGQRPIGNVQPGWPLDLLLVPATQQRQLHPDRESVAHVLQSHQSSAPAGTSVLLTLFDLNRLFMTVPTSFKITDIPFGALRRFILSFGSFFVHIFGPFSWLHAIWQLSKNLDNPSEFLTPTIIFPEDPTNFTNVSIENSFSVAL